MWFGIDLVRNDPFLRNQPIVLAGGLLTDDQILELCRNSKPEVVGFTQLAQFGMIRMPEEDPEGLRDRALKMRCTLTERSHAADASTERP
jgi:hypothetical protein